MTADQREQPSATELGTHLRNSRRGRRLSLRDVEAATGISNGYISQVENGSHSRPKPDMLHKLATFYGIDYADLLGLAGHPVPQPVLTVEQARVLERFVNSLPGLTLPLEVAQALTTLEDYVDGMPR
jgi:transcriptional regulator with XRE-family HTH domain